MKAIDILKIYEEHKKIYGEKTHTQIRKILEYAKEIHRQDFIKNPTPKGDFEQSWKGIIGNAIENLIDHILKDEIKSIGLKIISGKKFERTLPKNLPIELQHVKKNLAIDFGEMGFHIPDVDLVVYNPQTYKVLAVLSSKASLRERIAQSGYWNIKIKNYPLTADIKVFFFSPDKDGEFDMNKSISKSRAIAEYDIDGTYIMNDGQVRESDKVKTFDKFIDDLKNLIK